MIHGPGCVRTGELVLYPSDIGASATARDSVIVSSWHAPSGYRLFSLQEKESAYRQTPIGKGDMFYGDPGGLSGLRAALVSN